MGEVREVGEGEGGGEGKGKRGGGKKARWITGRRERRGRGGEGKGKRGRGKKAGWKGREETISWKMSMSTDL